jgi:tetratricopeptide (TPR) repeat protein
MSSRPRQPPNPPRFGSTRSLQPGRRKSTGLLSALCLGLITLCLFAQRAAAVTESDPPHIEDYFPEPASPTSEPAAQTLRRAKGAVTSGKQDDALTLCLQVLEELKPEEQWVRAATEYDVAQLLLSLNRATEGETHARAALKFYEHNPDADPIRQAAVDYILGDILWPIQDRRAEALTLQTAAVTALKRALGVTNEVTLAYTEVLGRLWLDQQHWSNAAQQFDEVDRELQSPDGTVIRSIGNTKVLAESRYRLGLAAQNAGETSIAKRMLWSAYGYLSTLPEANTDKRIGIALVAGAELNLASPDYARAQTLARLAPQASERADAPQTQALATHELGAALLKSGHPLEAEPVLNDAFVRVNKAFGPHTFATATTLLDGGEALLELNRLPEAIAVLKAALSVFKSSKTPDAPKWGYTFAALASAFAQQGQDAEARAAIPEAERWLEPLQTSTDAKPFEFVIAEGELGFALSTSDSHANGLPLLRSAYEACLKSCGPESSRKLHLSALQLAEELGMSEQFAEGRPLACDAAEKLKEATSGDETIAVADYICGDLEQHLSQLRSAEEHLREAVKLFRTVQRTDYSAVRSELLLAAIMGTKGRFDDARAEVDAAETMIKQSGKPSDMTITAQALLATMYYAQGQIAAGQPFEERVKQLCDQPTSAAQKALCISAYQQIEHRGRLHVP